MELYGKEQYKLNQALATQTVSEINSLLVLLFWDLVTKEKNIVFYNVL